MSPGGYLAGTALELAAAGAAVFVAVRVCGRWLPEVSGATRTVAVLLLAGSALALSVLLPGVLGILTRGTFLVAAVLVAVLAALLAPSRRGGANTPAVGPGGERGRGVAIRWERWLLPAVTALVLVSWLIAELLTLVSKPPLGVDFISYDLPIIGRWIQTGSVWHVTELFPLQTHGTYPQTADLVLAAVVLPFHNDALVEVVPFFALAVTGLAGFCIARELGAPRSTAVVLATMLCAVPTVAWDVRAGPPDTLALTAFAAGVLFLVRHVRSQRASELAMAGLGLGIAAGSLWYFTSAVAVLGLTWIAFVLVPGGTARSASWRQTLAWAGLLVGVIVAVSGFWLLRNLVETGDPFYPVRIAVAGHTIFGAPPDLYRAVAGWTIADYLGSPHVLGHYIVPALWKAVGVPGVVCLLAVGWVVWRSARAIAARRRPETLPLVLVLSAVLLTALYILTPYTAFGYHNRPALAWINVRYLIPAIVVALGASAAAAASTRRWPRLLLELAACGATVQGVVAADNVVGTRALFVPIGAVVTLLAAASVWLWLRRHPRPALTPGLRGAALAGGLAALVVVGYVVERTVNQTRYARYDPTFAWIQAHPRPLAVGLAGSFNFKGVSPAWPMFGERIQNRVAFVGRLKRGHLTQYPTRQAWLRGVREGHYDVLEISLTHPPPDTNDNEPHWAAEARFPVLARSSRLELVAVRG